MGYVKCAGYVWDMCGVRYANNLLKNPATKRLSGKRLLIEKVFYCDRLRNICSRRLEEFSPFISLLRRSLG